MTQKMYLNILRAGIYLSLMVVFFVFKDLLFPYITSKQLALNVFIEILFVFWVAFIVKYPSYRPKKSYITFGLLAFFGSLVVSSIFGIDFNLSFWGDVERMLGVFHLLHFLAFYLILITAFREWKDWKILFIVSVVYSIMMSINGLTAKGYATIGNTAYLSAYLIFNMYFAVLLFFREKNQTLRWIYLVALPFQFAAFQNADTTGAYVGLLFSLVVLFFLYAVLNKNKKIRYGALALVAILVLSVGLVLANKNSEFVKSKKFLNPLTQIDLQKNTFQTRLISWKAALKDFKNHPIVGTGHGNFAITFDKYFDPTFYNWTRGETYFDRAHNNVIDIASTSGALGLVTYLSIFIALAYYLVMGYRKDKINLHEFVVISCLVIAYFVQNLAVFDSLVTYMAIMMVLAYVYWLYEREDEVENVSDRSLDNKEIYTLAGTGVLILVIMFQFNIKPWQMLIGTIDGQRAFAQRQVASTIDIYKIALSKNTVLDRDSRTSLIRLFVSNPAILNQMDKDKAEEALDFLIDESEKNLKYNKNDSLSQMMHAQLLSTAARFYQGNADKYMHYTERALEAIEMSINASPGRIPIYFQKAQIQLSAGMQDEAIETLKNAIPLNEKYYDTYCHLARTYFYKGDDESGFNYLDQCIDLNGSSILTPEVSVKAYINHYVENQDWERALKLTARLTELAPTNVEAWINLAKLEADFGDKTKAKAAAEKAIEVDPSVAEYANKFIAGLGL